MTSFPQSIQTFPTMTNVTSSDGALISQYQSAIQSGDTTLASQILSQIYEGQNKIINADYINTILDTLEALQIYYTNTYSISYIVSENQPTGQACGDFWFQIIS